MFTDVIHWCPQTGDACIRKVLFAPHKDSSKKPVFSCSDCIRVLELMCNLAQNTLEEKKSAVIARHLLNAVELVRHLISVL